jgi:steroid delta-isomerase-like uncharacterized protein
MDNAEVISRHLAAFGAGNWDEHKSYLADNVKYEEFASRTSTTGRDKYVESVRRWKSAFPDAKAKVLNSFAVGDSVTTEIEWRGTHTGTLEGPIGPIEPTHKCGTVRAVLVSRVENGKIAETHHYFDMMTVLAQLGVLGLQAAQATQPRAAAEARASSH